MTCGQQRCSPEGLRARAAFGGGDALGRSRGSAAQLSSLLAFADAQAGQCEAAGSREQFSGRGEGFACPGRYRRAGNCSQAASRVCAQPCVVSSARPCGSSCRATSHTQGMSLAQSLLLFKPIPCPGRERHQALGAPGQGQAAAVASLSLCFVCLNYKWPSVTKGEKTQKKGNQTPREMPLSG